MLSSRKFVPVSLFLALVTFLSACDLPANLDEPTLPMGDFDLGHNIVVVNEPDVGPFSRIASDEAWQKSLTDAITRRFDIYDGGRLYNLGIRIDLYALAWPGVPVLFTPRSVLVVTATIWDDEKGEKLNAEPKQIIVFEGISEKTIIGSGLLQTKNQQMTALSDMAAEAIQAWMLENPEWFGLPPLTAEQKEAIENAPPAGLIPTETDPTNPPAEVVN